MSDNFLSTPSRGRRAAVIAVAAVVVLAIVAVAAVLAFRNGGGGSEATPQPPKPDVTVNVPSGPLTQLKGERTVEGVSVGYPHTTAGAVSAAAEYMEQLGSTLDLDRIRAIAPMLADTSYVDAEKDFVEGRIASRRQLGLPESGPAPAGASMTVGPAAFQLRSATPDAMTVLLLAYLTTIDGKGTITPRVIVMPVDMHWDGTDWKLLAPGASSKTDYSALVAQPGTPDAVAKGWQVLIP